MRRGRMLADPIGRSERLWCRMGPAFARRAANVRLAFVRLPHVRATRATSMLAMRSTPVPSTSFMMTSPMWMGASIDACRTSSIACM